MSPQSLEIGQKAHLTKRFGATEVAAFAATTAFERPIVHGMLLASLFSGLLGQQLPGKGSIYLGQNLSFKLPVFVGDEVTAEVEVIAMRDDKPIATLATRILTQGGALAVTGEAVVKLP